MYKRSLSVAQIVGYLWSYYEEKLEFQQKTPLSDVVTTHPPQVSTRFKCSKKHGHRLLVLVYKTWPQCHK